MSKTITVLGVTGAQGGSVALNFLSQGWNVRGITRNASSPAAQTLSSKGIEIVSADVDDPPSLLAAFSNSQVIFAVTDFWAPFFSSYPTLSKTSDRSTGEYAAQLEIQRGKNIVDTALQVLKSEGILERFVFSTLPSFKERSKGKYTYVYHFDSKAEISKYLREKDELWEKSSLLNMGFYTSNMIKFGGLMGAVKDEESGKYILRKPGANSAIHPLVVTADTGTFVDLLVRSPPKQDLLGVSEMASYEKYIRIWGEVTGVPSGVAELSVEDADKAAPGGLGREAAESTATSAEFGWGVDEALVLPKDLDPNVKLTSLKEYFECEDWTTFFAQKKNCVTSGSLRHCEIETHKKVAPALS